jgi:hypothetical protein
MANSYSTNTGLTAFPEFSEEKYPGIYQDSMRVRQAIQNLQFALDTYTGAIPIPAAAQGVLDTTNSLRIQGITKFYPKAGESLSPGNLVYLYATFGVGLVKKATANDTTKLAYGFVSSQSVIPSGGTVEITLLGAYVHFSGLTPGNKYYLSDTPGLIAASPGTNTQILGRALDSKTVFFNPTLI